MSYIDHYVDRSFSALNERSTQIENCKSGFQLYKILELNVEMVEQRELCEMRPVTPN